MARAYNVTGMWEINRKLGFTLIELLVAISIVGIISAVGLYISAKTNLQRGRDGRRQADIESIRSALEIYRSDQTGYPIAIGTAFTVLSAPLTGYITVVPKDPSDPSRWYYYRSLTAAGATCSAPGPCPAYELCGAMERLAGGALCNGGAGCNNGSGAGCNYQTFNP